MMGGRQARLLVLSACVAGFGCESEVTLRLLSSKVGQSVAGVAGMSSASDAGEAGVLANAGAGDAEAIAGRDGGVPTLPCQKLGDEVCNGGDDDCNGGTDEGCAQTVTWQADPNGPALGNVTHATEFAQDCPDGLDQVAAICKQVAIHEASADAGSGLSFTLGPRYAASTLPFSSYEPDIAAAKVKDLVCPDGEILAGVDGTTGGGSQYLTQRIRLSCAPPAISGSYLAYDPDKIDLVGPVECVSCTLSPTYNYGFTIPAGHVAAGLFGLNGAWIDLVGFRTSRAHIIEQ